MLLLHNGQDQTWLPPPNSSLLQPWTCCMEKHQQIILLSTASWSVTQFLLAGLDLHWCGTTILLLCLWQSMYCDTSDFSTLPILSQYCLCTNFSALAVLILVLCWCHHHIGPFGLHHWKNHQTPLLNSTIWGVDSVLGWLVLSVLISVLWQY